MCMFYSAVHGDSNVVSFSTQILSYIIPKDKATTTTTKNILTWQQIECPEKVYAILEAVKDHFKEKQVARETIKMIDNHCKVYYYSVHNYKMLYLLLGHCHWQCNDSPYPLCGCVPPYTVLLAHKCFISFVRHSSHVHSYNTVMYGYTMMCYLV